MNLQISTPTTEIAVIGRISKLTFHHYHLRTLLYSQTPRIHSFKSFSTSQQSVAISYQQSFAISYLINNIGLSPQQARKASKELRFSTPENPDSVVIFFKTIGFSDAQIRSIILKYPRLLSSNPTQTLLPKLAFIASKCTSPADMVVAVTRNPSILIPSLDRVIIPAFELVRSFCPSDQKAVVSIMAHPYAICDIRSKRNLQFLIDVGVTRSCIYYLISTRPYFLLSNDFRRAAEEVKELGFPSSQFNFVVALSAKLAKSNWDAKIDALKNWGFSEDAIFNSIKRNPNIMLRSVDKLNAVMSFWVHELGWDPSVLLGAPVLFGFSIEKRFIPRASVVKYLISNGLMTKDANLVTPFHLSDELFLKKYVNCYEEEEASRLLRLYEGKDASNTQCLDKL